MYVLIVLLTANALAEHTMSAAATIAAQPASLSTGAARKISASSANQTVIAAEGLHARQMLAQANIHASARLIQHGAGQRTSASAAPELPTATVTGLMDVK
jgi:hypothetical protein